jgi:hypothetical protein
VARVIARGLTGVALITSDAHRGLMPVAGSGRRPAMPLGSGNWSGRTAS